MLGGAGGDAARLTLAAPAPTLRLSTVRSRPGVEAVMRSSLRAARLTNLMLAGMLTGNEFSGLLAI